MLASALKSYVLPRPQFELEHTISQCKHAGILAVFLTLSVVAARQPSEAGEITKIKHLQMERVALLRQSLLLAQKRNEQRSVDFQKELDAQRLLLQAEFHYADTPDERIACLKELLDTAKRLESIVGTRFKIGTLNEIDFVQVKTARLLAKSARMEVEIRLWQELQKVGEDNSTKIRQLQIDQVSSLKQNLLLALRQYEQGCIGQQPVLDAQQFLLEAELQYAKTPDERIAILRRLVETAKSMETNVETQHRIGSVSEIDVLQVKAARLEAQIGISRELKQSRGDHTTKIRQLRKERNSYLRQLLRVAQHKYKQGAKGFRRVLDAQRLLLETESEYAETPNERIAVIEELLKKAKKFEAVVGQQFGDRTVTEFDVLGAKAARLEIQIRFLQARDKNKQVLDGPSGAIRQGPPNGTLPSASQP